MVHPQAKPKAKTKPNLKLEVVPPREKILRVQVDSLQASLDLANEECADARKQLDLLRSEVRLREKERDELAKTNTELKRLLHTAELDRERMRGYMDGIQDSKPPEMVPMKQLSRFGQPVDVDGSYISTGSSYNSSRKPWFEL